MPGKKLIHHAWRSMVRAAPIMKPQLMRLGSPRPMKLSALSIRMALAMLNEPATMMGDSALGRM